MFIKTALAAALFAGTMAHKSGKPVFGNVKTQTTKDSNTKLSAAFHKNNMGWARRQVAHWNGMKITHVVEHKHAHKGHHVQDTNGLRNLCGLRLLLLSIRLTKPLLPAWLTSTRTMERSI
jgi:hypothetical protein